MHDIWVQHIVETYEPNSLRLAKDFGVVIKMHRVYLVRGYRWHADIFVRTKQETTEKGHDWCGCCLLLFYLFLGGNDSDNSRKVY